MANTSNLPSVQRLKYEDFVRSNDWKQGMQSLVNTLNLFMTPTYDILNGGVTYSNLTAPQIYQTQVTGSTPTTFTFVNPIKFQPRAVLIGNCWSGIPTTHPAVALQPYWHIEGNTIVMDNIVGLTAGTQYTVVLVIL